MPNFVITGATSGIGRELAKFFSEFGVVFAGYRNTEKIEDLKNLSDNIIPFYIDMTDSKSIEEAAKFINNQVETIDMQINVAGCVVAGPIEHTSIERIREQFEVNTFSHLDFTQKLLPKIKDGKIVNISSMSSFGYFPFIAPYCASKRALDILFNSLAIESGVRVVSVKPGVIATPLWEKSIEKNQCAMCDDYKKEFEFLMGNAAKNGVKGLDVSRVVKIVEKIYKTKNPKASYCVGFDSCFAEVLSKLPQDIINSLVKFGLKMRIKK